MLMESKNKNLRKYFSDGETWDQEVIATIHQSRNRAWILTFFSMTIAVLSLAALLVLLPLKTFEPYIITVDRATGYTEITKNLSQGNLSQDEAVTQSNLVRYVSARESYNPSILRENYDFVAIMSDGKASQEFQKLWEGQNPDNPSIKYGKKSSIDIKIKAVAFLNDRTASVRFVRELRENDQLKSSDWNAIIDFQYTQKPMKMADRFSNPLGFKVTSYRVNPEVLESIK